MEAIKYPTFVLNMKNMKRFLGLFVSVLLLNSCDDGDVSVDAIDFTEVEANVCADNNIVYKIKQNEALFFELGQDADFATAFQNNPTPDGTPHVFQISENNRIFYRAYNDVVSSDNFCVLPPPVSPNVTEEWTVSSGRIEITTQAVIIQNTDTDFPNGEKIQKYRHNIVFKDIVWEKPGGQQLEQTYAFGAYDTFPNAQLFGFNWDDSLNRCVGTNTVYNYLGREGIVLNIAPNLIVNQVTTINEPRVGYLGTENTLTYNFYNPDDAALLTDDNFCGGALTPAVIETWIGVAGDQTLMTGRIEVTTTTSGPGIYLHDIHLVNVSVQKGNSQFFLADDYFLGQLITTD